MRATARLCKTTVILLTILINYSCKENSKTYLKQYSININNVADSLQSVVKSYTVLRLDNQPEAYFGFVTKFILTDQYLLFKNESKQSIIIYDKSGKYINSISKKGRGPGEYLYISDFLFDQKTKEITICDNDRLKKYSFKGEFISEQKFDSEIFKVTKMKNGNFVATKVLPTVSSQTNYYIRVLNDKLEVIDKRLPIIPSGGHGFSVEGQSYRTALNNDYAYFFSYTGDTIYHISDINIKPAYLLKYDRDVIITNDGAGTYKSDPNASYRQLSYYEIGDLSLLFFSFRNQGYCFSFNHLTGQSKSYFSRFPVQGVYNNQLVMVTNSMYLKKTIERIDPEKNKCRNQTDLDNALQNYTDDFQTIIFVDLDFF